MTNPDLQYALFGLRTGDVDEEFEWASKVAIGQGAYGSVYRVQRIFDSKWYAVKTMSLDIITKKGLWKQVVHEIEIHRRLEFPLIVKFIDAFRSETTLYMVLELVEGGELHKIIRRRDHPFTERDAALYTRQLLEALAYMHEQKNIVHRDLKPQNILVDTTNKTIKLIDFGFSKLVCRVQDASWPVNMNPTMPTPKTLGKWLEASDQPISTPIYNSPKGTIACLAPEILENIQHRNTRPRITTRDEVKKLDMFAVGVVVFFMLSGSYPFEPGRGQMDYAAHAAHILAEIKAGAKFSSGVTKEAQDLCYRLLTLDVKERLSVLEALDHPWIAGHTEAPETPLPRTAENTQLDTNIYNFLRKEDTKLDKSDPGKLASKEQQPKRVDMANVKGPIKNVGQVKSGFNLSNMSLPPPRKSVDSSGPPTSPPSSQSLPPEPHTHTHSQPQEHQQQHQSQQHQPQQHQPQQHHQPQHQQPHQQPQHQDAQQPAAAEHTTGTHKSFMQKVGGLFHVKHKGSKEKEKHHHH